MNSELQALAIAFRYSEFETARRRYAVKILELTSGRELTAEEQKLRSEAQWAQAEQTAAAV